MREECLPAITSLAKIEVRCKGRQIFLRVNQADKKLNASVRTKATLNRVKLRRTVVTLDATWLVVRASNSEKNSLSGAMIFVVS